LQKWIAPIKYAIREMNLMLVADGDLVLDDAHAMESVSDITSGNQRFGKQPKLLPTRPNRHLKGEVILRATFRRRDADGCDRDGRAPQKVANDAGEDWKGASILDGFRLRRLGFSLRLIRISGVVGVKGAERRHL
jgi:hypothetical protein